MNMEARVATIANPPRIWLMVATRYGKNSLRNAAPGLNVPGEDEKRYGDQGIGTAALKKGLGNHLQGDPVENEICQGLRSPTARPTGDADKKKEEKGAEEDPAHGSVPFQGLAEGSQKMQDDNASQNREDHVNPDHGDDHRRGGLMAFGFHQQDAVEGNNGKEPNAQKVHQNGRGFLNPRRQALHDKSHGNVGSPLEGDRRPH